MSKLRKPTNLNSRIEAKKPTSLCANENVAKTESHLEPTKFEGKATQKLNGNDFGRCDERHINKLSSDLEDDSYTGSEQEMDKENSKKCNLEPLADKIYAETAALQKESIRLRFLNEIDPVTMKNKKSAVENVILKEHHLTKCIDTMTSQLLQLEQKIPTLVKNNQILETLSRSLQQKLKESTMEQRKLKRDYNLLKSRFSRLMAEMNEREKLYLQCKRTAEYEYKLLEAKFELLKLNIAENAEKKQVT